MASTREKLLGQFFTPERVAAFLVRWAAPGDGDRVLDPSCGDGVFLRQLHSAVGVEFCPESAAQARAAAAHAQVVEADFFQWASTHGPEFDAIVGNPPFIRYQQFTGPTRKSAFALARRIGVEFNGLTSSWAPFLAVSASLVRPGGRMAFVVPAEIGHATYAAPLIEGLCRNFSSVTIVAIREKLFPDLSQDAWLLFVSGKGGRTETIGFTAVDRFCSRIDPDNPTSLVSLRDWRQAGQRLRKFLLPADLREAYHLVIERAGATQLANIADVTIGYVSGDNDFFHLSRSAARLFEIPDAFLRPTIRRGEQLATDYVDQRLVDRWLAANEQIYVLDLTSTTEVPRSVAAYLTSPRGEEARARYKCRVRDPWYVIPGVAQTPSAFITCMSGRESRLAINRAGAVCTNSVLSVSLMQRVSHRGLLRGWRHPLSRLCQELEGHPLGGGMLKLEPGEARRVHVPLRPFHPTKAEGLALAESIDLMRTWRHYGPDADRA